MSMSYFYASSSSYPLQHPSSFESYQQQYEQPGWPPTLDLGDQYYSMPLSSAISPPLSAAPSAPSPPKSMYNVSYSLAGALTPGKQLPTPPQCRPAVPQLAQLQPLRYAGTDTSSLLPLPMQSLRYSLDVASPEEFVYEPDIDGSSLPSLSLSPSRALSLKDNDMSNDLSSSDAPSQAGKSRRAAGARASRGRRAKGHGIQEDDDLPLQPKEQPFECDVCGAHFARKHDGARHRLSHTGEKPFPCHGGCAKAFRRGDARSRHWSSYRDCEWRHTLFLDGTVEGLKRERRILQRAKRIELVAQGMPRQMIARTLKKM